MQAEMLTRIQVAERLKINGTTLVHKIKDFNASEAVQNDPSLAIKPDAVEDRGNFKIHLYREDSLPKIDAAIKAVSVRSVGRPRTVKEF